MMTRLEELAMAARAASLAHNVCARCIARDAQRYLRMAQEAHSVEHAEALLKMAECVLAQAAKLGGD
jgi:hypothetical protein